MPLDADSLIVTVGGSTSNSFVSLADAQSFHNLNLGSDAWFAAEEGDQVRALVKAARRLNQENWLGSRVTDTQALSWPRNGAEKVDNRTNYYGGYYCTNLYSDTEIPQQIKDAQCLLALAYLDGFADGEGDSIQSWQADDVSITYRQARPDGLLPSEVTRLIGALIQGPRLIRS